MLLIKTLAFKSNSVHAEENTGILLCVQIRTDAFVHVRISSAQRFTDEETWLLLLSKDNSESCGEGVAITLWQEPSQRPVQDQCCSCSCSVKPEPTPEWRTAQTPPSKQVPRALFRRSAQCRFGWSRSRHGNTDKALDGSCTVAASFRYKYSSPPPTVTHTNLIDLVKFDNV